MSSLISDQTGNGNNTTSF